MRSVLFILALSTSVVFAQDSTQINNSKNVFSIQFDAGMRGLTSTSKMNEQLAPYSIKKFSSFGSAFNIGLGMDFQRFQLYVESGMSTGGNYAEQGAFQIFTTQLDFGLGCYYGLYPVSMFHKRMTLQPSLKGGVSFMRVASVPNDDPFYVPDYFVGGTNYFYTQSEPQFYVQPGLNLGFGVKQLPLWIMIKAAYHWGINQYHYDVVDYPLFQVNGINAQVGIRYSFYSISPN